MKIPDVGSCIGGLPGQNCTASPTRDGNPEILVGAPGADLNGGSGVDMGLVYVLDGLTRGIMKRVQLGPEQTPDDPVIGRTARGEAGLRPQPLHCLGDAALPRLRRRRRVPGESFRISEGDLDQDGTGDVVIGAPLYRESADWPACTAPPGQACPPTGRIYVVSGAKLGGTGRRLSLSDDSHSLVFGSPTSFPYASEDGAPPDFGASVLPLGDVSSCDTSGLDGQVCPPANLRGPDGIPDVLVSSTGTDAGGVADAGAAFVLDGGSSRY